MTEEQATVELEVQEFRLRTAIATTWITYVTRLPSLLIGAVVILGAAGLTISRFSDSGAAVFLSPVVVFAALALLLGYTTIVVEAKENDRRLGSSDLRRVGTAIVPVLVVTYFQWIFTGIGFGLLAIPGFLLLTRWAVAVPAVVVEKTSIGDAFSRSTKLVMGKSWRVFWFVLGLYVLMYGASVFGTLMLLSLVSAADATLILVGLSVLILFLVQFLSVALAVLYFELKGHVTEDLPPMDELVKVENLTMHFPISKGMFRAPTDFVHAVDDISFSIQPGESLGLVGESGCGKTTTGRMILKLADPTGGTIAMTQQDEFDVFLNHAGGQPDELADTIQSLNGVNSTEAAELVANAPTTVLRGLDETAAKEARTAIQAAGGIAELTMHIVDVAQITGAEDTRDFRGKVQMIFQDPYESMNPRRTVYDTIAEPLAVQGIGKLHEREERVAELLTRVGLTPAVSFLFRYPHELSGGQRQRVAIARALVLGPSFVVADEPTSMLDVSIRISIMDLMLKLASEYGVSYLYITHDLAVARYMCDRIAVMYLGKIVEIGDTETVLSDPKHPYTKALLSAVPVPDPSYKRPPVEIKGGINKAINPPPICRFIERCPISTQYCRDNDHPPLEDKGDGVQVACYLVEKRVATATV